MGEILDYFKQKKNLANLLLLGILILALPLGVNLIRQQQLLKSRAEAEPIKFTGPNVEQRAGKWVALKPQISLELTSPLGPPAGSAPPAGMDFETACKEARDQLVKLGGDFQNSTCAEIKTKVCGDCKLFRSPNPIRDALCGPGTCQSASFELVKTVYAQRGGGCEGADCTDGNPCTEDRCVEDINFGPQCVHPNKPAGTDCEFNPSPPYNAIKQCDNAGNCSQSASGGPPPVCTQATEVIDCTDGNPCTEDRCNELVYGSQCDHFNKPAGTDCEFNPSPPYNAIKQCDDSGSCSQPVGGGGGGGPPPGSCRTDSDCSGGTTCRPAACDPNYRGEGCGFFNMLAGTPCGSGKTCDGNGNCVGSGGGGGPPPPGGGSSSPSPSLSPSPSGACTVKEWSFSSDNPPANTLIKATVKGVSDPGGWQNVVYKKETDSSWVHPAVSVTSGPTFSFDVNSGTAGEHTVTLGVNNGAQACTSTGSFTTGGAAAVTTVSFRIAESLADLNVAQWIDYTDVTRVRDFEFKDKTPGQKFIFVQFKDSTGKTTGPADCPKCQAQIELLGADPVIANCSLSFEGDSTVLNLTGQNFGSKKGAVKSGDTNLQIKEWKADQVKAVWPNAPTGQSLPVSLINAAGQTGNGLCGAISQLALGAKVFCRAPSSHDTDNVDLVLAGAFEGGAKTKQKVKIDKDGIILGLDQKLENGKNYKLSLKAPKSLRKTVSFTAGDGVTNIPDFVLPVGDIFPLDTGDGTINALDKSELNREWIIAQDATGRSGDFNRDGRVNSIDWACMRYDFGKADDAEAAPGGPPAPSPSPRSSGLPLPL